MAKRRPAGDGMVRRRDDGRWEGRIVIGHRENGEPLFRHVYAKTQKALLDKLGIHDEDLLAVNPKLVIVHISGLGNAKFGGIPSVCNRASYDMIGQAFSGWLYLQGDTKRVNQLFTVMMEEDQPCR